ncbi:MAG: hypothetical protein OEY01_15205 [Desulfobulbaceae bacterium]|nr:hypothetical protein [Desulfobulbaceae bacterium]
MKRGQPVIWLIFLIAGTLSVLAAHKVFTSRSQKLTESIQALSLIPPTGAEISAMEFKGISSDFFLLRVMTFLGLKFGERTKVSPDEWHSVYKILDTVTTLDPKFWDPYLLAGTMVQEGGPLEHANRLLLKAGEELPNNYRPYALLWYNTFYLEDNPQKAGLYLKEAIKRPGAPFYYTGLAARMDLYADRTKDAIAFLKSIILDNQESYVSEYLKKRLISLQIIDYLEEKLKEYELRYGNKPKSIEQLVLTGLIKKIPTDPYGGTFYLLPTGRVYTTSKLVEKKK